MKTIQNQLSVVMLFLALIFAGTGSWAQSHELALGGAWGVVERVPESELPEFVEEKGDFVGAAKFTDQAGEHVFVVWEKTHPGELKNDVFVDQWVWHARGGMEQEWGIKDFAGPLCTVGVVPHSLQVLDLDGDGLMETCFIYDFNCDGTDPTEVKLMLFTKGEKLAIRGQIPFRGEGKTIKNIDPKTKDYPAVFQNFMSREWEAFAENEDGIEYAKSLLVNRPGFRLMRLEYLYASGGWEYELQQANGLPVNLSKTLKEKIRYANPLTVLPDSSGFLLQQDGEIGIFEAKSNTYTKLITLFEDTEAVSSFAFSPGGKKVAFIALNLHAYPKSTRLFVLDLKGNEVLKKQKFDLQSMKMAAASWVVFPPEFVDEHTIEFPKQGPDGEQAGTSRIKVD